MGETLELLIENCPFAGDVNLKVGEGLYCGEFGTDGEDCTQGGVCVVAKNKGVCAGKLCVYKS